MSPRDVAGREESPVYAILKLNEAIDQLARCRRATQLEQYTARQPSDRSRSP